MEMVSQMKTGRTLHRVCPVWWRSGLEGRRLCAAEVGSFAGVDANLFAFVDEGRNLDDEAGFELGRLGDAGGGCGLDAGLGLDDGQLDGAGQVDADGDCRRSS
jgi:hypothetical protein